MADIGNLWNTITQSTNQVVGAVDNFMQQQAKMDISNMQIRLEREANAKLLELQKNNDYSTWEQEMDNFYTERVNAMADKNSPYYCRNNYTANLANNLLENSRNAYQQKAAVMAWENLKKQALVKYNESCSILDETTFGQEQINRKNQLAANLYEAGILDPLQYENELEKNWYKGTFSNYTHNFTTELMAAGINAGKDFESVWNEYEATLTKTKKYGADGLEVLADDEEIRKKAKAQCEQSYTNLLYQVQTENQNFFNNDINELRTNIIQIAVGDPNAMSMNEITNRIITGTAKNDLMDGLKLAKGQQKQNTKEYESMLSSINEIKKARASGDISSEKTATLQSFESYIKALPEQYMQRIADGTFAHQVESEQALENFLKKEFFNKDYKETYGLSPYDKQKYWETHYAGTAAMKILNSSVIKNRLDSEPQFASVKNKYYASVKQLEADAKKNPKDRKYTEGASEYITNFVYKLVASSGRDTDMNALLSELDANLNAITLNGLEGLFKGRGRGVLGIGKESEEKYLARTANELNNNDIVILDVNGAERWAPGTKDKVDEIARSQKAYIEQSLGITLSPPQYQKTDYDIKPIPEFTDNEGNVYHIEATEDGKDVNIINDKGQIVTGKTTKDLRNEDELAKGQSKDVIRKANEKRVEYQTQKAAETNQIITEGDTMPSIVKATGSISESEWADSKGKQTDRQIYLNDAINQIDIWAKSRNISDEEFKKKVGISRAEWQNMTDMQMRYRYLMK